jgi:hypothetical protein
MDSAQTAIRFKAVPHYPGPGIATVLEKPCWRFQPRIELNASDAQAAGIGIAQDKISKEPRGGVIHSNILWDRTNRAADVVRDISKQVGGQQTFLGPTVAIPYSIPLT